MPRRRNVEQQPDLRQHSASVNEVSAASGSGWPLSGVYTSYRSVQGAQGGVTVLATRNVTLIAGSPKLILYLTDLTVHGAL